MSSERTPEARFLPQQDASSSGDASNFLLSPFDYATLPTSATGLGRNGRMAAPMFSIAETMQGRIQGIGNGRVWAFRGVPYGPTTSYENRFKPPQKPKTWSGIRDAFGFGQVPPQAPIDPAWEYATMLHWDSHIGPGGMGEDCLNLNVWTPAIADGGKRAVLVCFHGGGWVTGSVNGAMYDGARLAEFGDVVVITVNHRIGALGFCHLADLLGSDEPSHNGNYGMMDLVAALEWVRSNAEAFGGDPERVMVFGQSGGGWKISTLMAMPSGKGLYHGAAIQSGAMLRVHTRDQASETADRLLHALGLRSPYELSALPWQSIIQAQAESGLDFRPMVDGAVLPQHPFDPVAPAASEDVPMLIGTTREDLSNLFENFDATDLDIRNIFRQSWGERGNAIFDTYRAESPDDAAFLIQGRAYSDAFRSNTILQASRKAARQKAPTYLYVWDHAPDSYDNRYGATHAVDLDASFRLARSAMGGAGRSGSQLMCDRMAASLIAFAKTGSPDNPLIPAWPPYENPQHATMIFDSEMRVEDKYREEFLCLIQPPT